jgi:hypothetical protein
MNARKEDVASIDAIVNATYDVISGKADDVRDWERMKSLYIPGARVIPFDASPEGRAVPNVMTPDQFVESRSPILASGDFYEWETERREDHSGAMAHVWSGYEAARTPRGAPIRCGVNSFQLWFDGDRWWIVSIAWDAVEAKRAAGE